MVCNHLYGSELLLNQSFGFLLASVLFTNLSGVENSSTGNGASLGGIQTRQPVLRICGVGVYNKMHGSQSCALTQRFL